MHHYSYLHEHFGDEFLRRVLVDHVVLWEKSAESHRYDIALGSSLAIYNEGELSLIFRVDGVSVFILSFSFVPGRILGFQAQNALLITRLQGIKGHFAEIRDATKTLDEVDPPAVLIAALQGIGAALELECMAGVTADGQVWNENDGSQFVTAYDEFWNSLGASRSGAHFFHLPIPLAEKPLELVKQKHRHRTKLKREFKKQIIEDVRRSFQLQLR
jgi:hypothetical protein